MPTYTFRLTNNQDDQVFEVTDMIDTTHNPIFLGAINHDDTSPDITCWQNSDGVGKVIIKGSVGGAINKEIDEDGQVVDF